VEVTVMSDIESIFDTAQEPEAPEPEKGRATDTSNLLVVPLSSFDFLEGKYRAASRTRLMNTTTVMIMVALVAVTLLQTVDAKVSRSATTRDLQRVTTQVTQSRQALQEEQLTGAATRGEVDAHIKSRVDDATATLGKQIAYRTLIEVLAQLGPDAQVIDVTFLPPEEGSGLGVIVVNGRAANLQRATEITNILADPVRYPYFSKPTSNQYQPSVDCQSTADESSTGAASELTCQWKWAGVITDQALTPRRASVGALIPGGTAPGGEIPAAAPVDGATSPDTSTVVTEPAPVDTTTTTQGGE
jgi:hypothetical protein